MAKLIDYNTLLKGYNRNERKRTWQRLAPEAFTLIDGDTAATVIAPTDVIDAVVAGMTEKRGWIAHDEAAPPLTLTEWPEDIVAYTGATGSLVNAWLYGEQANGRCDRDSGLMVSTVISDGQLTITDGHRLHSADVALPSDAKLLFDSGAFTLLIRAWAVSPRSASIELGVTGDTHYARIVNGPILVTLRRVWTEKGWVAQPAAVMEDASKVFNADAKYALAISGNPDELRHAIKANELGGDKSTGPTVAFIVSKAGAWFIGADQHGVRHLERSPRTPVPALVSVGADIAEHFDEVAMWVNSKYLIEAIDPAAKAVTITFASSMEPLIVQHDGSVVTTALVMPMKPVDGVERDRPSEVRAKEEAKREAEAAVAAAQAAREAAADF